MSKEERIDSVSINLVPGLAGLDDSFDDFQALFELLQISSIEATEYEDVLTFATSVAYFAQIQKVDIIRDEKL